MTSQLATILVIAAIVKAIPGAPQDFVVAQSQTEEKVVGLLGLPEVFGDFPCQFFEPRTLDLYATASTEAPLVGIVELLNPPQAPQSPDCEAPRVAVRRVGSAFAPEMLPTDESGYEMRRAVVYERSDRWFRIALESGSAWIQRDNSNDFISYPEFLVSDAFATYLRPGWDGNIWNAPGSGTPIQAPAVWRTHTNEEIPVRVTSTQIIGGEPWIRVRFETDVCGQSLGDLPALETWLRAYRSTRTTSIWFYSRGC